MPATQMQQQGYTDVVNEENDTREFIMNPKQVEVHYFCNPDGEGKSYQQLSSFLSWR
jgi:hypothetical protein